MLLTTNIMLLYMGMEESKATPVVEKPRLQKIRHIGLPTRGKYTVREETEKAPSHDHPCNLTRTAVKISFPEDMRREIFVNLLGYKEPNLVHLNRCRGWCGTTGTSLTCTPTRVREKKVKMMIRSFLTGKEPVDKMKELILDEHEECGCQCSSLLSSECSGRINNLTCECDCPTLQFGERKEYCQLRRDAFWDSSACQCKRKTIAARGADLGAPVCEQMAARHLDLINTLESSDNDRTVDLLSWAILGSSLTMVLALSITTCHYRNRVKKAEKKFLHVNKKNYTFDCPQSSKNKEEDYRTLRKIKHSTRQPLTPALGLDLVEDGMREAREGTMCEQYNEHGVQIENNYFD